MSGTVFFNGKIYTPAGVAEALLADGQTIAAVGRNGDVLERAEGAERIDLGGRLMLPGFIDGHMHFLAMPFSLEQADLTSAAPSMKSGQAEVLPGLGKAGEWVSGEGGITNTSTSPDLHPGRPGRLAPTTGDPVRVCVRSQLESLNPGDHRRQPFSRRSDGS